MVVPVLKSIYKSNQKSIFILTGLILSFVSYLLNGLAAQIVFLVIFLVGLSKFMPSKNILTRLAYVSFLPIVASPIYLILRKPFNLGSMSKFDFLLMLCILGILIFLVSKFNENRYVNSNFRETSNKNVIAGMSAFFVLALIQLYLYSKSLGHLFSWFGSGDSRNHLGFGRHVADIGGLNPLTMLQQPIGAPAFLGMLLGWKSGYTDFGRTYLVSDLFTYGFTWVYFIGLIGLVFSATTYFLWTTKFRTKEAPSLLLAISSIFALTGLILGTGLSDGFYTAIYGGLTTSLMILWLLESQQRNKKDIPYLILGMFILIGSLTAWSFMLLVSLPIFMIGLLVNLNLEITKRVLVYVTIFLALCLALVASDPIQGLLAKAKEMLSASGRISSTTPEIFTAFAFIVLAFGVTLYKQHKNIAQLLIFISSIEFFSIYILKLTSGLELFEWSYYTLKFQWISLISISGLTLSCILIFASKSWIDSLNGLTNLQKIVIKILVFLFAFNFVDSMYGGQNIWKKAFDGWSQPNAAVMNTVIEQSQFERNPTILFRYTDPGNEMLGNFWLTLYVEPVDPLRGWLYSVDTQNDVQWLCDLRSFYPEVSVITSDPTLSNSISQTCSKRPIGVTVIKSIN